MKVVFHGGAAADLTTAGDWYEDFPFALAYVIESDHLVRLVSIAHKKRRRDYWRRRLRTPE